MFKYKIRLHLQSAHYNVTIQSPVQVQNSSLYGDFHLSNLSIFNGFLTTNIQDSLALGPETAQGGARPFDNAIYLGSSLLICLMNCIFNVYI